MEQKGHVGDVLFGIALSLTLPSCIDRIYVELRYILVVYRVVYGRWKNWLNDGGEVIGHSPAPDYHLRFDARLVQAAAREMRCPSFAEIVSFNGLKFSRRYNVYIA